MAVYWVTMGKAHAMLVDDVSVKQGCRTEIMFARSYLMIACCAALLLTGCASDQVTNTRHVPVPSLSNNIMAYNPQLYSLAYRRFLERALSGDAIAQNNLGHMFEDGRGVGHNDQKAIEWFSKAAMQENLEAEINLGMMYFYGKGIQEDERTGCQWFSKAKQHGSLDGKTFYEQYCV